MFTSVARRVANTGVHTSTKRGISVQVRTRGGINRLNVVDTVHH
jgi:hypothetical protein